MCEGAYTFSLIRAAFCWHWKLCLWGLCLVGQIILQFSQHRLNSISSGWDQAGPRILRIKPSHLYKASSYELSHQRPCLQYPYNIACILIADCAFERLFFPHIHEKLGNHVTLQLIRKLMHRKLCVQRLSFSSICPQCRWKQFTHRRPNGYIHGEWWEKGGKRRESECERL